jgi:hypothetical protein
MEEHHILPADPLPADNQNLLELRIAADVRNHIANLRMQGAASDCTDRT